IVEGHGGRIWVEGEEGKGSRFIFALPLEPRSERGEGEEGVTWHGIRS
ncbi:MAG: hypothetical protein HZA23_01190, partial [Nitrospirae bacterium]|nr:hypothetical protein [Nitrospirota bacterium]